MSGSPCPLPRRVDPLLGAKSAASPLVHSVAQSQQKCLSRYSSASNLMQTHWKNYLVALPTTFLQDWKHLSSKLIYFMLPWTTSNSDPSVSFSLVLSEHMAAMRHMAPPNPMFHASLLHLLQLPLFLGSITQQVSSQTNHKYPAKYPANQPFFIGAITIYGAPNPKKHPQITVFLISLNPVAATQRP